MFRRKISMFFSLGLGLSGAWACSNQPASSELQHNFGHPQRGQRSAPLEDCKPKMNTTSPEIIDNYLRKIAETIAAGSPEVFKGDLSLDKFCFQFDSSDHFSAKKPNAWADPRSGLIWFNSATLSHAPNDAAVAAVMAHELAHITMDHGSGELHEDLLNNEEFMKLYKLSDAILNGEAEAPEGEDYASIVNKQTELAIKILGGDKNVLANVDEQQADEVGFELYLKAGFDADFYTWIHTLEVDPEKPLPECSPVEPIARGDASHPHRCWRLRNIKTTEMVRHQEQYAPYMQKKTVVLPGELGRVITKIQQMEYDYDPTRWIDY